MPYSSPQKSSANTKSRSDRTPARTLRKRMSEPILCVDTSEIRDGKLEEPKTAMNELVEFVGMNEPRLIRYNL